MHCADVTSTHKHPGTHYKCYAFWVYILLQSPILQGPFPAQVLQPKNGGAGTRPRLHYLMTLHFQNFKMMKKDVSQDIITNSQQRMHYQVRWVGFNDWGSRFRTKHVCKISTLYRKPNHVFSRYTTTQRVTNSSHSSDSSKVWRTSVPSIIAKTSCYSRFISYSSDPPTIPILPAVPLCASKVNGGAIALTARSNSCLVPILHHMDGDNTKNVRKFRRTM